MSNDTTYNGWTNYETWLVNLWLDNDQRLYAYLRDMAENAFDRALSPDAGLAAAAELLSEWFDNEVDILLDSRASLFMDILNAHSREVNWDEIAEHMLEEYIAACNENEE